MSSSDTSSPTSTTPVLETSTAEAQAVPCESLPSLPLDAQKQTRKSQRKKSAASKKNPFVGPQRTQKQRRGRSLVKKLRKEASDRLKRKDFLDAYKAKLQEYVATEKGASLIGALNGKWISVYDESVDDHTSDPLNEGLISWSRTLYDVLKTAQVNTLGLVTHEKKGARYLGLPTVVTPECNLAEYAVRAKLSPEQAVDLVRDRVVVQEEESCEYYALTPFALMGAPSVEK